MRLRNQIEVLLEQAQIKQYVPFSPPRNCSFELKITFCVRGVISPLLSNLYLNEVDQMLERAKAATRQERGPAVEYARFADDLVILVDSQPRSDANPSRDQPLRALERARNTEYWEAGSQKILRVVLIGLCASV